MCKKMFRRIFLFVVPVMVLTGVAQAADPSLIGWWKLDEASGTVAHDSSGNGIDGAFTGEPQWVEGIIGGALQFDGVDDGVDT